MAEVDAVLRLWGTTMDPRFRGCRAGRCSFRFEEKGYRRWNGGNGQNMLEVRLSNTHEREAQQQHSKSDAEAGQDRSAAVLAGAVYSARLRIEHDNRTFGMLFSAREKTNNTETTPTPT